ncbi:MAG: alpha/beta fold hydrolase [Candidatus Symbiothrix sp.]|jgi:pimeloyl-ACP methyl ester carboxylesterase|nr:alpha/beta fold hydrolase [Candidatus Symbiothrix sp.]
MKQLILSLIISLATLSAWGQDITGQWNGVLKVQGTQLRLVLNITNTGAGYNATLDSPDQGAKDIPATSTSFENKVLTVVIATIGAEYEGTPDNDSIVGTFKQMGQSFPLNLSRKTVEKEKIVRPQEPVKPYPYNEEEVFFENTMDGVTLAGTFTYPKTKGTSPAVILISGSGAQNRDEELMGHKPFLVLSDYLTRNGIAVLRFDDRGTAKSTGDFKTATSFDFSKDVEAGINYLQTRKEVNKKKIGLAGHSEGGMIAPMVAARSNDVAFIVLLAGVGIPIDQLLLLQEELIAKASGLDEADWQKGKKVNQGAFELIKQSTQQVDLLKELLAYFKQVAQDIPRAGVPEGVSENDLVNIAVSQLYNPWMQYFIKYDPAPVLEKVKCPVLAINGSKDLQVPAQVNLDAIKAALQKGGNKQVTTEELPGLNHLFQACETGLPAEYATIEQTFSPVALEEIGRWITAQAK